MIILLSINCDVLVVGAGPAGSTTAKYAAEAGADVLILDKRRKVGVPVQCAEYLPWQIVSYAKVDDEFVAQKIVSMHTHMPDGGVVKTPSRGFIVNRNLFDQFLAKKAVDVGAKLLLGTRAVGCRGDTVEAIHANRGLKIVSRVIVGADGPSSTVGRWINCINSEYVHAMQYIVSLEEELDSTEVYFRRYIPMGYGWVFPKGKVANVGVGIDPRFGVSPKIALAHFLDELVREDVIRRDILGSTGGLIPVGGLLKLWHGNAILVGDAAGQCHPITGAGVPNAIICGEIAGKIIGKAVGADDLGVLSEYEGECIELIGDSLKRAVQKRRFLYSHWNTGDAKLADVLKRSWVAFEGYYTRTNSE